MKVIMMVWEDEILYKTYDGWSEELKRMCSGDNMSALDALKARLYGGTGNSEEPDLGMVDCGRPVAHHLRELIEVKIIDDKDIPAEAVPCHGTMRLLRRLKLK